MPFTGGFSDLPLQDYIGQQARADWQAQTAGNLEFGGTPDPYAGLSSADVAGKFLNGQDPTTYFNTWRDKQIAGGANPNEIASLVSGNVRMPTYADPGDTEGLLVLGGLTAGLGGLAAGAAAAGGAGAAEAGGGAAAGAGGGAGAGSAALEGSDIFGSVAPGGFTTDVGQAAAGYAPGTAFGMNIPSGAGGTGSSSTDAAPVAAGVTGPSMITPDGLAPLSADTAAALGIDISPQIPGEFGLANDAGLSSIGVPSSPGFDSSIWTGAQPTDIPNPVSDQVITPEDDVFDPTKSKPGALEGAKKLMKELGLSPATAGMLGISGLQALSKAQLPDAAKALQAGAVPGSAAANAMIQSGGTAGPAWATQKASIDATIDQQIKEQSAAMVQQAINSGQGADSQVVQQQVNKIKNQLETQRQTLYAQAQSQNVQAALGQLGISDQALSSVAQTQFAESNQAKSAASETARNALMLQALSRQQPAAATP